MATFDKSSNTAAKIIAHRGSSHLAPENTLASLQLGWRETTTCELDIRPALDGRLLVIHDASTKRTTGIDLTVAEHPLRELQQLDAGSWKGPQWKGEKLPSLEEVLAAMPADKRLFIEIKAGPEIIPELSRVIRASGKERQLWLQSFSLPACLEAKKALPAIPVHLLVASRPDPLTGTPPPTLDEAIVQAKSAQLDGLNFHHAALPDAAAVEKIHSAGLQIHVWTVDDVADAKRLLGWGIDSLTTNRPGWLKTQLGLD